jgi:antitoxin PrlF
MPKLTSRGRITIPVKVRSALGVRPGDQIKFVEIEKGQFVIVSAMQSAKELKGKKRRPSRRNEWPAEK